jgi:hypothetical protein
MDEKIAQEILHELFESLEALDTQSAAISQFLRDKGIATDAELAPYLERAGNASSVRWLAVKVRIEYLLSSARNAAEQDPKKESPKSADDNQKTGGDAGKDAGDSEKEKSQNKGNDRKETGKDAPNAPETTPNRKPEAEDAGASGGGDEHKQSEGDKGARKNTVESGSK